MGKRSSRVAFCHYLIVNEYGSALHSKLIPRRISMISSFHAGADCAAT